METQLYLSLTILTYVTIIMFILVGSILVKVLLNVSKLTKNLDETTDILKAELVPTLKNVNKTVEILSGIVIKTDEGLNKVKEFLQKSPFSIVTKLTSGVAKGFWQGLCTAFKIFKK